jgi:hypothetical protein
MDYPLQFDQDISYLQQETQSHDNSAPRVQVLADKVSMNFHPDKNKQRF